ncbi:MAG TPA: hypothetical protein VGG27_04995 [Magnetospirillaceae bacterium]|jgi:hypothetical protein
MILPGGKVARFAKNLIRRSGAVVDSRVPSVTTGAWNRVRLLKIDPDNFPHGATFDEIIDTLFHAFAALGVTVDIARNTPLCGEGINLVFGAHLRERVQGLTIPLDNSVVYNLELMEEKSQGWRPSYFELMRQVPVWESSGRNAQLCRAIAGHDHVHVVPIGYMPQMTRIKSAPVQDVDILFYGAINDRRKAVLLALQRSGFKLKVLYGVYGAERDAWIARSKLVLNIHLYDLSVHELVRSSYLLANRKVVVSECNSTTDIEEDIRRAVVAVPYDRIVPTCLDLIRSARRRQEREELGYTLFSKRNEVDYLRAAVVATSPFWTRPSAIE